MMACKKVTKLIGCWTMLGLIGHAATAATVRVEASSSLNFTYQIGGVLPPSRTIDLNNTPGLRFTVSATTTSGGNWLSVSPMSGRTNDALTVSVQPVGLAVGTYNGSVIADVPGGAPSSQTFSIQLTIASTPLLTVTPSNLSFNFTSQSGGTGPSQQNLTVSSTGASLSFNASVTTTSGGNWLSVSPTTGATQSNLSVAVSPTALGAGTYNGSITISSPSASNSPASIPVVFTVVAAPTLSLDKNSLSFSYQPGKSLPGAQNVSIVSSAGAINYTAIPSTSSGGPWLSAFPSSGMTPGTVSIGVNPSGLLTGTYNGSIAISSPSASNSPISITVVLNVTAASSLSLDKNSLSFTYKPGNSLPGAQSVAVASSVGAINYTAIPSTSSGGSWLTAIPSSGTTPGTVSIGVNPTGLSTGTYNGSITISSPGASNGPISVPVILNVTAAPILSLEKNSLSFNYQPGSSLPGAQSVSVASSAGSLNYTAIPSTNSGGSWLTAIPSSGTTPGAVSISVNPNSLAPGTYNGVVIIASSEASNGPQPVLITLIVGGSGSVTGSGSVSPPSLSFTFGPCSAPPGAQTIFVSAGAAPVNFTVSSSSPWLLVSATSGTTPATIQVSINSTGLSESSYFGAITVAFTGSPSVQIPVAMTLESAGVFYPSSDSLVFTYQPGIDSPPPQVLNIASNCDPVSFTISVSKLSGATSWLSATPSSGNTSAKLSVTASAAGLSQGTYFSLITIAGSSPAINPTVIPVQFNVGAAPLLSASSTSVTFTYRIDDPLPKPQIVTIASEGGPVNYSLFRPNGATWLSLDSTGGTAPSSFSVSVNPTGIPLGTYSDTIRITASDPAVTSQIVIVNLVVTDTFSVSPQSLSFNYQAGGSLPPVQGLSVSSGGSTFTFTASTSTSSGGSWLSVNPSSGSNSSTEAVSVNPAGLAPGVYEGAIKIVDSSNKVQIIPVTLTVTRMSTSRTQTISHIADGGHWQTDIILINTDTVSASFTLNFWADNGTAFALPMQGRGSMSTLTDTIPVGGSRTIRSVGTSSVLTTGWAEVISSQSIGGSAVFREHESGQEASVSLTSGVSQRVSFPFENGPGLALGVALVNTDAAQAATVSVTLRNEQGQVISTEAPIGVPRHGHTSFVVPVRSSRPEDQRGIVELSSSVTGLVSLGIRSSQGAFTSTEPLSARTQASQSISHVADGGQWQTDIVLVNMDNVPATFTLNAWGDNGVALSLPISGRGNISTFTDTIPVGGSRTIRTAGISSVLTTGWAEVITSQSIAGAAIFRVQDTGQEASVSLSSAATRRMLFSFENGPGLALGVALANPNPTQGALVSVTLRNEQGQVISTEQPIQLQVDGHSAFVIPMRSAGPDDKRGVVELNSPDSAIVGLGIRGNGKAFTSVQGTN